MKLLIATGLYAPEIGGPATYTAFLEKHLPRQGVAFEVLPYSVVRGYPKIFRHLVYLIKLMLHSRGVTAFYALDTVSVGLPVCTASFLLRKPYLLRVPGDYAWEQGQQRYGVTASLDDFQSTERLPLQVRILVSIQRWVARRALHIIVPSEYMKWIVAGWGVDMERITRIYSVLKDVVVTEPREVLRETFGYQDFVVTTAGRLVPWKGMKVLIDAVVSMRTNSVPVTLEIIGDGVCREELSAHVAKLGAEAHVHVRGMVSREELARRITASDAFVLNTAYEGLSHQLLEVMSIGVPIVTTPVGGNVELIKEGETGIFVPYDDREKIQEALEKLYTEPGSGKTRADRARMTLGMFREDVVITEFVTLLKILWKS
jgi:glycosyltransferase involved in cell wall biosynthesis